jgi:hypothetical protein
MTSPSICTSRLRSIIASTTPILYPFFSARVRTSARTAEVILASTVSGSFSISPPAPINKGAAAPMTLCGAMKIF